MYRNLQSGECMVEINKIGLLIVFIKYYQLNTEQQTVAEKL